MNRRKKHNTDVKHIFKAKTFTDIFIRRKWKMSVFSCFSRLLWCFHPGCSQVSTAFVTSATTCLLVSSVVVVNFLPRVHMLSLPCRCRLESSFFPDHTSSSFQLNTQANKLQSRLFFNGFIVAFLIFWFTELHSSSTFILCHHSLPLAHNVL